MNNLYVYIAAPWFTPDQAERLEEVKEVLDVLCIEYYSPKDDCLYVPGDTTPQEVLRANLEGIDKSDFIVCVTDGKDVGTIWEAGYAYQKVGILYVWFTGTKEQKFNLMLAATGDVVRNKDQLVRALKYAIAHDGALPGDNRSDTYEIE